MQGFFFGLHFKEDQATAGSLILETHVLTPVPSLLKQRGVAL